MVEAQLAALVNLLHQFHFAHAPDVGDFYLGNMWRAIVPAPWRAYLESLDLSELAQVPTAATAPGSPPLEIAALFTALRATVPSRAPISDGARAAPRAPRGVTPKKNHECHRLGAVIANLARPSAPVFDVGCGCGHFAQGLAENHRLTVVGVDGDERLVAQGQERFLKSALSDAVRLVPRFINTPADILDVARQCGVQLGTLTGLHSCGDLTAQMLRAFVAESETRSFSHMAVASCCYHKITDDCFPLSAALRERWKPGMVTGASLRAACLSPARWDSRDAAHLFQKHHFRAMFEVVVRRWYPHVVGDLKVGHVADRETHTFPRYVAAALQKLDLPADVVSAAELADLAQEYAPRVAREVAPYWTLRALAGQLVESLVLVDRVQFLHEHGHADAHLHPAFDPAISPRNMLIII